MAKRKGFMTRHEMSEKIDRSKKDMGGREINLDKIASDVETVRRTLENLDFGGTIEGSEQVENAIEKAEDVTSDVFAKEDEGLEKAQKDIEGFEGEIRDHHKSSESDLGRISESKNRIETKETVHELEAAREVAVRDIDFLIKQIERAREARERSNSIQEKLLARVQGGNRRR